MGLQDKLMGLQDKLIGLHDKLMASAPKYSPMCRRVCAAPYMLFLFIMGKTCHSGELLTQAVRAQAV